MIKRVKCYTYTRVSTSMQVDGYSLDAQIDKLRKYAEYQNWLIVGEYSDEGKSGKSINGRPEFLQMLEDIENNKDGVSFVLVFKLSRFGRNAADVLSSLQKMQDYGVNLICVEDGIDSSKDSGKLMISVLSAVAEIERENILVQTMEGRKQKAREGKWNGGFAPYGYKLVNGNLEIAEDEVEAVKTIFDKYIHTQLGVAGVAKFLNNAGFKKNLRGNNKYEFFTPHLVKLILDNPVYYGKIAFGRRGTTRVPGTRDQFRLERKDNYILADGIHEAIVSEDVWNEAHQKRLQSSAKHEKIYSLEHEHILSGILKCPICGASMYGGVNRKKKKDGTYYKDNFTYVCKHRKESSPGVRCDYAKNWNQDIINGAVAEIISKFVREDKIIKKLELQLNKKVDTSEIDNEMAMLKKKKNQLEGAKKNLIYKMDGLDITDPYYDKKYEDMEARLDRFYEEIDNIEAEMEELEIRLDNIKKDRISTERAYQCLLNFDKFYAQFTDAEKKEVLGSFISEIQIYPERQNQRIIRSIKFKFPVQYGDMESDTIHLDKESTVETLVVLLNKEADERSVTVEFRKEEKAV